MYEKITAYTGLFSDAAASDAELQKGIAAFGEDFAQLGLMREDAMEVMGELILASKDALRQAAPTMSAERACACIAVFLMMEPDLPGTMLDLIRQDVLPQILKRLQELDA